MGYSTLTTGIYVRYEALLALEAAAILALVLVALAVVVVLVAGRFRLRGAIYRSTPGAGRSAQVVRLGRWRWPALAFCHRDRRRLPRAASRRPRLVDRGRRSDRRTGRRRVGSGPQLGAGSRLGGRARRSPRPPRGAARVALSVDSLALARAAHALSERAAGNRGRARAGLLRRAHRRRPLPELRPASVRVPRPLHAVRARVDARVARHREPAARRGRAVARPATTRRDDGRRPPARSLRNARRRGARLPQHREGAAGDAAPAPDRLRHAGDGDLGGNGDRRLLDRRAFRAAPRRDRGAARLPPLLAKCLGAGRADSGGDCN